MKWINVFFLMHVHTYWIIPIHYFLLIDDYDEMIMIMCQSSFFYVSTFIHSEPNTLFFSCLYLCIHTSQQCPIYCDHIVLYKLENCFEFHLSFPNFFLQEKNKFKKIWKKKKTSVVYWKLILFVHWKKFSLSNFLWTFFLIVNNYFWFVQSKQTFHKWKKKMVPFQCIRSYHTLLFFDQRKKKIVLYAISRACVVLFVSKYIIIINHSLLAYLLERCKHD